MSNSIRFLRNLTAGTALATAAVLGLTACQPAVSNPGHSDARTELSRLMVDAVAAGVPGVAVRIDTGDDEPIVLTEQDTWTETISAADTFRVGSNTKTATAVLVLQLVGDGRLGLDDPIDTWFDGTKFDDAVPAARTTTVRMLLNHTSGLADYAMEPEILAAVAGHRDELPSDEELIAAGVRATAAGDPVEGYRYSNAGYTLLGQIVEQITGRPIQEVFAERITKPLGLTETRFPARGAGETAEIRGYEPGAEILAPLLPPGTPEGFAIAGPEAGEGWTDVTAIDQSWDGPAGSIISTAAEWATFQRALMAGDLVTPDLLDQMQDVAPEVGPGMENRSYGLGLEKVETSCGAVWGHDGALPGYRADTYTDLTGTRSMAVVSTTNFGLVAQPDASAAHDRLVDAAACAMYGE